MRRLVMLAAMSAGLAACGSLKLEYPLARRAGDWPVFGGSPGRTGISPLTVTPPLRLEWEEDVSAGIGPGSPILVDSVLLIGNLRGELVALHARNGRKIGSISLGEAVKSSPVVEGGTVFLTAANTRESLIAYSLLEGKTRWRAALGDIEVSPLLYAGRLYAGTTDGSFHCVDAATGDSLWSFRLPNNKHRKGIRSSPAAEGGLVVFGADDGSVYALDAARGTLRWSHPTGISVVATPAIDGGHIYACNLSGTVFALDTADGRAAWTFPSGSAVYATTAVTESLVVFGTTAGTIFALGRTDGRPIWRTEAGGPVSASAVVSGEFLYVGTLRRELLAVRLTDGAVVWKAQVAGRIKSAPAVAYGRVFVACDDRMVRAFGEVQ